MRKRPTAVMLCLLGFAGVCWFVQAGELEPPGSPAPTMKTLDEVEARIPIHEAELPRTISQTGSYYLAEDVSLSKTWYYYNANGNVTRIVSGPPDPQLEDPMTATRFDYAENQRAVAFIVGEAWQYSGQAGVGTSEITFAREFRYDKV